MGMFYFLGGYRQYEVCGFNLVSDVNKESFSGGGNIISLVISFYAHIMPLRWILFSFNMV